MGCPAGGGEWEGALVVGFELGVRVGSFRVEAEAAERAALEEKLPIVNELI